MGGHRIQHAHIDHLTARAIDVLQQTGDQYGHPDGHAGGERPPHERLPLPSHAEGRCLVEHQHAAHHDGDERTDEQAHGEEHTGEQVDGGSAVVAGLKQDDQRREAEGPCRRVLRLIQQDAMQAIDLQTAEHPVADRVDVQQAKRRERLAMLPEVVQLPRALKAREQHRRHHPDRGGPGAAHEMPNEEVEERDITHDRPAFR